MKKIFYIANFILLLSYCTSFVGCKSGHKEEVTNAMEPQVTDDTTTSITRAQDTTTNAALVNTTAVPPADVHVTAEKTHGENGWCNPCYT
jgi:hypothetical protein